MTRGELVGSWACLIRLAFDSPSPINSFSSFRGAFFELRLGLSNVTTVSQRYKFVVVVVASLRPVPESVTHPANSVRPTPCSEHTSTLVNECNEVLYRPQAPNCGNVWHVFRSVLLLFAQQKKKKAVSRQRSICWCQSSFSKGGLSPIRRPRGSYFDR